MTKLKPQLIVAGPSKKKGGFASGIGYFLVLAIVFILGVYVGMGVNGTNFNEESLIGMTEDAKPSTQSVPTLAKQELTEDQSKEVQLARKDTNKVNGAYEISEHAQEPDSALLSTDHADESSNAISENTIVESSADNSQDNIFNKSGIIAADYNALDNSFIDQDKYRLQVAAFSNIDRANEVVNDLRLRGYNAYIVTTSNSRGEVWNLIKVGNFDTAQEAWNYAALFQSKEGGEVFVESLSKGRVYNESSEETSDTL